MAVLYYTSSKHVDACMSRGMIRVCRYRLSDLCFFPRRLDTLMGGDFQQYRANVSCGRAECTYISAISEYTF